MTDPLLYQQPPQESAGANPTTQTSHLRPTNGKFLLVGLLLETIAALFFLTYLFIPQSPRMRWSKSGITYRITDKSLQYNTR
jgi:hypothetical protein